VHPELGKPMPVSQLEKKLENMGIVWFRQKAIKNWYSDLDEQSSVSQIESLVSHLLYIPATYPHNHVQSSS